MILTPPKPDLARDQRWILAKNDSGEDIPAFAAVERVSVGQDGTWYVRKPTRDDHPSAYLNAGALIPKDGHGIVTRDFPAWAYYNAADGQPSNGESLGTRAGFWQLHRGFEGFLVWGAADGKKVFVQSDITCRDLVEGSYYGYYYYPPNNFRPHCPPCPGGLGAQFVDSAWTFTGNCTDLINANGIAPIGACRVDSITTSGSCFSDFTNRYTFVPFDPSSPSLGYFVPATRCYEACSYTVTHHNGDVERFTLVLYFDDGTLVPLSVNCAFRFPVILGWTQERLTAGQTCDATPSGTLYTCGGKTVATWTPLAFNMCGPGAGPRDIGIPGIRVFRVCPGFTYTKDYTADLTAGGPGAFPCDQDWCRPTQSVWTCI